MDALSKFGQIIAEDLRNSALNRHLDIESGFVSTETCKTLTKPLKDFTPEQLNIVRQLITEAVDCGIHDFLFALESRKHDITVKIDKLDIADLSDGLNGELYTKDGWFECFSQHKETGLGKN